jgi:ATP-dependent Clp protease adaptor protein ClpS
MTKKQKDNHDAGSGVDLIDKQKSKNKITPPSKYKVVMHNDNFTPMDIVVAILMTVFKQPQEVAFKLMMDVHEKGKGIAGVYPKQIAETKVSKATMITKQLGYPFLLTMEKN